MATSWNTIAIVGVGMIGGSIGQAMLQRGLAQRVVGVGRNAERLQLALETGAVSETTTELAEGVRSAELIIVCTPVETIPEIVATVAEHCPAEALITDAGSTKAEIVTTISKSQLGATFLGSHPMAGSEKAGVAHADPNLLNDRVVIVTPTTTTNRDTCERLIGFWKSLGAKVYEMSPTEHDRAVASISHLPHLVASALAAATPESFLHLAATGWQDTTRIASGDAELWRQILQQNRTSILNHLSDFENVLASFREGLEREDDSAILKLLIEGKQRRDALAD